MTLGTVERVLYELSMNRAAKDQFRADAPTYLAKFALAEPEREMLAQFDVRGLSDMGVNPMLTMGFWMELEGSRSLPTYTIRMRDAALVGASKGDNNG
jgi:hypothetical protein